MWHAKNTQWECSSSKKLCIQICDICFNRYLENDFSSDFEWYVLHAKINVWEHICNVNAVEKDSKYLKIYNFLS